MGRQKKSANFEKPKNMKATIKRLLSDISAHKIGIIIIMLMGAIGALSQVIAPVIQGKIIDEIINAIGKNVNVQAIFKFIVVLMTVYLVGALFNFLQSYLLSRVSQSIIYKMRSDIQHKLRLLPLSYYDRVSLGDLLSRVTNDVELISSGLLQTVPNLVSIALTLVTAFIAMVTISGRLTVVAVITVPLSMLLSLGLVRFSQKYFAAQQEDLGELGGFIEESFTGHEVIKAFSQEKVAIERFEDINNRLNKNEKVTQFVSFLLMPISAFFSNLGYIGVVFLGGMMFVTNPGSITVGNLQAFLQIQRQFTQPIAQLANMVNAIQSSLAAAERVFEFLEEEEEPLDYANPIYIEEPEGNVVLEHVKFGYNDDNIIIKDLNLTVSSEDKVAIVGPTGAGKTTFVNLLMRFYDIQGGVIKIDNVDITQMTRNHLRSMFGMVLQDTWLFKGTIMENIRYGNLNATDEEVVAAAKSAYVHEFVKTQPGGYNMVISEDGGNISSGQRQLITIARAFLSNPHILILDEATSLVDTRTEVIIQKAMEKLMGNRTSFVIAHRLSTIRDAKMILVLKDGDIIEKGNHTELLAENGFYSELYHNQLLGEEI